MDRDYHRWFSPHLERDMELLVFGRHGARVLVFPTRAGRFYDYEDWGLVDAVRDKIDRGWLQLICVDSLDAETFYCTCKPPADRLRRHRQYEHYLLDEVLPFSAAVNPNPFAVAHGCSMGAYHAVTLALRHPGLFGKVVGLSGRYDLTAPVAEFRDLLDGHYDADVYFHTPTHFLTGLWDGDSLHRLRHTEITLAVGADDPFLASNRLLSGQLWERQVWHGLHVWDGRAHKARYWRQMTPLYL